MTTKQRYIEERFTAHEQISQGAIVLDGRDLVNFGSNDYLGLAGSRVLADAVQAALDRGVPVGSGGSRLLRGNHPEHEALEAEAALFFGWTPGSPLPDAGMQLATLSTMVFASIVAMQMANAFECRSDPTSLFRIGPFTNRLLVGAVAI